MNTLAMAIGSTAMTIKSNRRRGAMSPIRSEFSDDWPVEPPPARAARRKPASQGFIGYLITFGAGIAAAFAWQSYGNAARQIIADAHPHLAWLAPPAGIAQTAPAVIVPPTDFLAPQEMKTISFDLAKMSKKVDQLAAAQEQTTREITKLQAVEQYVLYRNIEPPPRPAPAPNPAPKPSPAER
jgi:hypothetical protein